MMKAACSVDSDTCCLRDNVVRAAVKCLTKSWIFFNLLRILVS